MKALSLWQPWASLVALNLKRFETRSWSTPYRGEIAIHAAKHWTAKEERWLRFFADEYDCPLPLPPPLGSMLCICRLTHIGRSEEVEVHISAMEHRMGDYTAGRFAWRLEVVEIFDKPIPARGKQGLFDWERPSA